MRSFWSKKFKVTWFLSLVFLQQVCTTPGSILHHILWTEFSKWSFFFFYKKQQIFVRQIFQSFVIVSPVLFRASSKELHNSCNFSSCLIQETLAERFMLYESSCTSFSWIIYLNKIFTSFVISTGVITSISSPSKSN